jgi:hypothetical protein
MVRKTVVLLAMITALSTVVVVVPRQAGATATPPVREIFGMSSMTVFAGSQVTVHWAPTSGASAPPTPYFIVASNAPDGLPDFSSPSVVRWPSGSVASWNRTWHWWRTTNSTTMRVSIPSTAAAGTTYGFELYTCDQASNLCSNSPGGDGVAQVTLEVAGANWSRVPYEDDFSHVVDVSKGTCNPYPGNPLAVTFSTGQTIWDDSEFSGCAVGENAYSAPKQPVSASTMTNLAVPYNLANTPEAECLFGRCAATAISELGEAVTYADQEIWSTRGGAFLYTSKLIPNDSEVVAYNPSSSTLSTYLVPGTNQEIIGIAATGTGSGTRIWFDQSGPPELDSFMPSAVTTKVNGAYPLAGAPSFEQFRLPVTTADGIDDVPAQVAADPSGNSLWVSQLGGSEIDEVNASTGAVTPYPYPSQNKYSTYSQQASPWGIAADADYVYAIDVGDSNIVRLDKATGHIDQVPIPQTSTSESGYGLALSPDGSRLYFTIGGDAGDSFGAQTALGYIDLSNWTGSAPTRAMILTGLSAVTDPAGTTGSYCGIAVTSGQVAIADPKGQVIRLIS